MSNLQNIRCCIGGMRSKYGYTITPEAYLRHKEITNQIKRESERYRNTHRILLLGTGESGKSTFLRQMRLICGEAFSDEEMELFRDCIYDNTYKGMLFLLQARKDLKIPWERGSASEEAAAELQQHFQTNKAQQRTRLRQKQLIWQSNEFSRVVPCIKTLWQDPCLRRAFQQRSRILADNFSENSEYFLNHIDRIGAEQYRPTNEDVVWSRRPTKEIVEVNLTYKGQHFLNFTDVGGQSTERPRWFHLLRDRNFILFVVAASHFDEYYVDRASGTTRNKMVEAVEVLLHLNTEGILNHNTNVVLFLNKHDVLEKKLADRVSNIRDHFPAFPSSADPYNLKAVENFIVDLFFDPLRHLPDRHKFRHFTTAVNRKNIDAVFKVVYESALLTVSDSLLMK